MYSMKKEHDLLLRKEKIVNEKCIHFQILSRLSNKKRKTDQIECSFN